MKNLTKQVLCLAALGLLSSGLSAGESGEAATDPATRLIDYPINSYREETAMPPYFDEEISRAAHKKEHWPFNPLLVVINFLTERPETQSAQWIVDYERAEVPLKVTVTLFEDGYMDDSVAGAWSQYSLERRDVYSPWRLQKTRDAYLCHRGEVTDAFQKALCP